MGRGALTMCGRTAVERMSVGACPGLWCTRKVCWRVHPLGRPTLVEKYNVDNGNGKPLYEKHAIIPVIINYRGFLYYKTRELLERFIPELNLIRLMCEAIK